MPTDYGAWPDWAQTERWTIPAGHLATPTDDDRARSTREEKTPMTVRRTTKRRVSVRERILNAITAAGRPLSVTAIADELGKPPESGWVQRGFGALIREGVIKVAGDGFVLAT